MRKLGVEITLREQVMNARGIDEYEAMNTLRRALELVLLESPLVSSVTIDDIDGEMEQIEGDDQ